MIPPDTAEVGPVTSGRVLHGREVLRGARDILNANGYRDEMVAITRRMIDGETGLHSVVVVGEVSTGKSTLVNALLGSPDLSPVGDGETTGTYLNFVPPTDTLPVGRARVEFIAGSPVEIPNTELHDWVCVGSHALVSPDGDPPLGVVISADNPSLPGIVLTDTPGTGGLNPAHARLAIKHSERASVLLLVTDASGRITRPELDFLAECANHVEAIVVAVNQIDLTAGWQDVVEENQRILLAEDARYADIDVVGVSAYRALQASQTTEPERAARRRASSHIDDLVDALAARLAIADRLPVVHAIRSTQALLDFVFSNVTKEVEALMVGTQGLSDLESELLRIQDLESDRKTWRQYLNRDFRRLRAGITDEIRDQLTAFSKKWSEVISHKRMGILKEDHQRMTLDMHADANVIIDDLSLLMDQRISSVIADLFRESGLSDFSDEILENKDAIRKASLSQLNPAATTAGAPIDIGVMFSGYTGFNILSGLLPGFGVVGAGAMIALNLFARGAQQRKSDLSAHLRETVQSMQADLAAQFESYLIEFVPEVEIIFERELSRTITELNKQVKLARSANKGTEEQRDDMLKELTFKIEAINEQLMSGNAEMQRLLGR
ncbi:dynamin family protein [Salinibacterium sp. G-O1]|uniref:dynamin family protein n=1 Tax=Salinibacterium sp. G-O1 TaxID=3046208 RepID=UPI0024BBA788|nr:dynamin family protein [Salinibacterium sp. G-O1]MDJ0334599.1 dynamin family protein [Salinibacterium sp. G-O1]